MLEPQAFPTRLGIDQESRGQGPGSYVCHSGITDGEQRAVFSPRFSAFMEGGLMLQNEHLTTQPPSLMIGLLLPRPMPMSLKIQASCYVVDFIFNPRQQGPQWENQKSEHFIKFLKKDLASPIW